MDENGRTLVSNRRRVSSRQTPGVAEIKSRRRGIYRRLRRSERWEGNPRECGITEAKEMEI